MSKVNNVNPSQYKVAGREHQGDEIIHEENKQAFNTSKPSQGKEGDQNFIPGAAPVGVSEKKDSREKSADDHDHKPQKNSGG